MPKVTIEDSARKWIKQEVDVRHLDFKIRNAIYEAKIHGYKNEEEDHYVALVETIASGSWGSHMPEKLIEFFMLDIDPEDEFVWDEIDRFANAVADMLTEDLGLSGQLYFGNHEFDGSYCLWYAEKIIEE